MITIDEVSAIVHLSVGLFLIWLLVFLGGRDYRIDSLRQQLFSLRDELFDYAAGGGVDFEDPAYRLLRDVMNGMIRFAHKLSLLRLYLVIAASKIFPDPPFESPYKKWEMTVSKLPQEKQEKLHDIRYRMIRTLVVHMVFSSPMLPLFLVLWGWYKMVSVIKVYTHGSPKPAFSEQFRDYILDAQALEEQEEQLSEKREQDSRVAAAV